MEPAYVAGLFDGEGYIRVNRWEKPNSPHVRYQVIVGLGMTYQPVILGLQEWFGGSIHENRRDLRNPKHRIQFSWLVASQTAATFLRTILPHLIVKREEAQLALELQANIDLYRHKLGHHHKFHPDRDKIFAYRADLAAQIAALKHRVFLASNQQ
jgi:hypothetical protein